MRHRRAAGGDDGHPDRPAHERRDPRLRPRAEREQDRRGQAQPATLEAHRVRLDRRRPRGGQRRGRRLRHQRRGREPAAWRCPDPAGPGATDWWAYAQAVGGGRGRHRPWPGSCFPFFQLASIIMVYLLGVILVATRHGRGPSFLASLLSVVAFDFFFVPPYLTFAVSDAEYLITFAVMLLAGFVISSLTVRIRSPGRGRAPARAADGGALRHEPRVREHPGHSTRCSTSPSGTSARSFAVRSCSSCPTARAPGAPRWRHSSRWTPTRSPSARWVYEHRQAAGLGTTTLPGARALYVPLMAPRGPVGVLGIRPPLDDEFDTPERLHELETFANQTALAIERARLAEEAQGAQVQAGGGAPAQLPAQLRLARSADAAHRHQRRRQHRPRQRRAPRRATRAASCWTRRARRPSGSAGWSATCSR